MDVNKRVIDKQGYTLHIIDSKKFKTIHLTAKLRAPLVRETITNRALLPFVLQQGTERYPTANAFRRALDDLYGATFSIDGTKKGEQHVLSARMTLANETYLSTEENILQQGIQFFSEAIVKPKQRAGRFDEKIVAKEKQTLQRKIAAITDDKMHYANIRLVDEMCANEPYQLHVHGYPEDLDAITAETLYEYYAAMIEQDQLDVYIMGDLEAVDVEELIGNLFDRQTASIQPIAPTTKGHTIEKPNQLIEEQDIQQGKLHIGYRTYTTYADQDYPALQVFNAVFGGFPSSKLFINVREKHSLAYYAASQFESHKGLLFVYSGIAPSQFNQAKSIILEQMEAIKKGDFSNAQIQEAKDQIINQYKQTLDDPFGIIEVMYNQKIANSDRSITAFIKAINQVDSEAISRIANKLQLDTVYFLTAQGGQTNESN